MYLFILKNISIYFRNYFDTPTYWKSNINIEKILHEVKEELVKVGTTRAMPTVGTESTTAPPHSIIL